MPYIPNEDKVPTSYNKKRQDVNDPRFTYLTKAGNRVVLDPLIDALAERIGAIHKSYGYDGAFLGLVNYSVTRLVTKILLDNFDRPRYWHSPAIRGVLQDIGDELYRRVFVPYEDHQIAKNGDVPEYLELLKRIK